MTDSAAMHTVSVLIPLALPGPYDYSVPPHISVVPGAIVRVPLGPREIYGVVWGEAEGAAPPHKIKPISALCDVPALAEELRQFVDWVANYVMSPPGAVLRQVMRVPAAFAPPKPLVVYAAGATRPEKITPARQKVFDAFAARGAMTSAELARVAGVSGSVVKTLIKNGHLTAHELPGDITFDTPDAAHHQTSLSAEQGEVASALRAAVQAGDFSPHLLDGVTGAGKTEVYFEAIAQALEMGKKALVLLPEISLTTQFLDRFEARFGCAPALWHSGLSPVERRRTWRELAENRISVLVGARSALFLPWRDLGVIIVDEEHDGGFKQEDGVIYNARDMAVVRAQLAACAVVLSTATPSLETYVNARDGRYQAHRLTARHGAAQLPEIELVDMRAHQPPRGAWLVPQMVARVGAAIERGEQALLFLNRRGYAPLTLCRACGHRYACPDCDAWMVEHRFRKQLQCHHCGHVEAVPDSCQICGETDKLAACGPGVERITEEIIGHFPDARTVIL